jgi:hypothetical protein
VGRGTGARSGDQPSTSDLATRAQSESVHECSFDSRNLMLLLETAVSKLKNVCAIAISLPLTTAAVILRLRSWRGISTSLRRPPLRRCLFHFRDHFSQMK